MRIYIWNYMYNNTESNKLLEHIHWFTHGCHWRFCFACWFCINNHPLDRAWNSSWIPGAKSNDCTTTIFRSRRWRAFNILTWIIWSFDRLQSCSFGAPLPTGSAGRRVSEAAHAAPRVPLCTAPTGKAPQKIREGMATMDGTHNDNNHEKSSQPQCFWNCFHGTLGRTTTKNGKQNGSTSSGVQGFSFFSDTYIKWTWPCCCHFL